jgi:trehalose 6-phosphate phosphatase
VSDPTVPAASLAPLLEAPHEGGLFVDFDGTVAEITEDPEQARPVDGAVPALEALAERFGRVGVVSGRPVSFLQRFFDGSVLLAGLDGLEVVEGGQRREHPLGGAWREVVDDVAAVSRARGPEGMRVEAKGISLTLHFRGRPDIEAAVREWAERQARRSGLRCRPARMSVELHPPIPTDRGTALLELAAGLGSVCFIGDDHADHRAFDALDELATRGVRVTRVAVRSAETDGLVERADVVLDGPREVLALVEHLCERTAS